jgi:hypothetical protein
MAQIPVLEYGPQKPSVRLYDLEFIRLSVLQEHFQVISVSESDDPGIGPRKTGCALACLPERVIHGVKQLASIAVHRESVA